MFYEARGVNQDPGFFIRPQNKQTEIGGAFDFADWMERMSCFLTHFWSRKDEEEMIRICDEEKEYRIG